MKYIELPSGLILDQTEVRELKVLLTKLAVYSDTAVTLKRELFQAVRKGKIIS